MFDYMEKTIRSDRDTSPKRVSCPDEQWQKYENLAQDEKGAMALRYFLTMPYISQNLGLILAFWTNYYIFSRILF